MGHPEPFNSFRVNEVKDLVVKRIEILRYAQNDKRIGPNTKGGSFVPSPLRGGWFGFAHHKKGGVSHS